MLGIIRKDLFWFAVTALGVAPGVLLIEWLAASTLTPVHAAVNSAIMIVQVVGVIFMVETTEERSGGYRFLSALPLTSLEIVAGKSILVLGCVAVITAVNCLVQAAGAARNGVILAGLACLLVCGAVYAGILALGLSRFAAWLMVFFLAANVLLTLVFRAQRERIPELAGSLRSLLADPNWVVMAPAALLIYVSLAFLAARLLRP